MTCGHRLKTGQRYTVSSEVCLGNPALQRQTELTYTWDGEGRARFIMLFI